MERDAAVAERDRAARHRRDITYLAGVNTNLRVGDALLLVGADFLQNRTRNQWDFRILDRCHAGPGERSTYVHWSRPLGSLSPPQRAAALPQAFALRQRAAVFGHNAPASPVILLANPTRPTP